MGIDMKDAFIMMVKVDKQDLKELKESPMADRHDIGYASGRCDVWKIIMGLYGIKWDDV